MVKNTQVSKKMFECTRGVLSIVGSYVKYITDAIKRDSHEPFSVLALLFIGSFGFLIILGILALISPILIPMILFEALGFKICR